MFGRRQEKIGRSTKDTVENIKENKRDAKKRIRRQRIAQNVIKYNVMLENGICCMDDDVYSKAVLFRDINYQIAPDSTKKTIIEQYRNLLNSLGNDVDVSLVINNRLINREEFENNIIMSHRGDGLDPIRGEMNQHLLENMHRGNNSIMSEKMFVFSCRESNYHEAEKILNNLEKDFMNQLNEMGCEVEKMNGIDRLRSLHYIMKPGEVFDHSYAELNPDSSTKDWISPYAFHFKANHFEMDDRYCCAMTLINYPTWMQDNLIHELSKIEYNLVITLHMQIQTKDDSLDQINKQSMLIDSQVDGVLGKRHAKGDFTDKLPPKLEAQVETIDEWRQAIVRGDERMFQTQLVVLINADSEDEMHMIQRDVERIGKRCSVEFIVMDLEQEMGLNAALPLGLPKEGLGRNLLTDNVANIVPFTSKELLQTNKPIFYGINQTTNNMILCSRANMQSNGNGFILGRPGAGKSFVTKKELTWILLNDPEADIIIIDPQGEYRVIAETINRYSNKKICDVLEISSTSKLYFNPFDGDISQEDFVKDKANFIQTIMAEMIGNGYLSPEQKSIIDQVVTFIYQEYETKLKNQDFEHAYMPTLKTFYEKLGELDNSIAKQMQTALWIYVYGSYDLFAHESNIKVDSRLLVYDIHNIGSTIETLGFKIVLESIRDKIYKNKAKKKRTYVYIDEIYKLLADEYSDNFLYEFWKWVRKFNVYVTGMTQNVTDLLRSTNGSSMLQNSSFYIILGQDANDLMQLKSLLRLSEEQVRYVLTARPGAGLIRFDNTISPFADDFPKDTICYEMWNTDPDKQDDKSKQLQTLQDTARSIQRKKRLYGIHKDSVEMEKEVAKKEEKEESIPYTSPLRPEMEPENQEKSEPNVIPEEKNPYGINPEDY